MRGSITAEREYRSLPVAIDERCAQPGVVEMIDLEAVRIVVGFISGIGTMFFLILLPVMIYKMREQKKQIQAREEASRKTFHNAPTVQYILPARVLTAPSREEIAWNMHRAL